MQALRERKKDRKRWEERDGTHSKSSTLFILLQTPGLHLCLKLFYSKALLCVCWKQLPLFSVDWEMHSNVNDAQLTRVTTEQGYNKRKIQKWIWYSPFGLSSIDDSHRKCDIYYSSVILTLFIKDYLPLQRSHKINLWHCAWRFL